MKPEMVTYIRYRVRRSKETLQMAKLALDNGYLHDTVNRLYYACFYTVSALLLTEGFSSSKHSGIRSLFGQHWIRTGRLPAHMGRFYHHLFENRRHGDYDDFVTFDRNDVEAWFQQAEAFVAAISGQIEQQLGDFP